MAILRKQEAMIAIIMSRLFHGEAFCVREWPLSA